MVEVCRRIGRRRWEVGPILRNFPIWALALGCSTASTTSPQSSNSSNSADSGTSSQLHGIISLGVPSPTMTSTACVDGAHMVTHATYCDEGGTANCRVEDSFEECLCTNGVCLFGVDPSGPWGDAAPDAHPLPPDPPKATCNPQDPSTDGGGDGASSGTSDGGSCDLPPSFCVGPLWMGYYTNARCEDGRCRWDIAYTSCRGGECFNGGCQILTTN
jgi:hypothetical protein